MSPAFLASAMIPAIWFFSPMAVRNKKEWWSLSCCRALRVPFMISDSLSVGGCAPPAAAAAFPLARGIRPAPLPPLAGVCNGGAPPREAVADDVPSKSTTGDCSRGDFLSACLVFGVPAAASAALWLRIDMLQDAELAQVVFEMVLQGRKRGELEPTVGQRTKEVLGLNNLMRDFCSVWNASPPFN